MSLTKLQYEEVCLGQDQMEMTMLPGTYLMATNVKIYDDDGDIFFDADTLQTSKLNINGGVTSEIVSTNVVGF